MAGAAEFARLSDASAIAGRVDPRAGVRIRRFQYLQPVRSAPAGAVVRMRSKILGTYI
jgi:hypothetical protein